MADTGLDVTKEFDIRALRFDAAGLIPAIAQERGTGRVLMIAYMNKEAIEKTISTGQAHYFSRERQKLWMKGETSGHTQRVCGISYDCDADAILLTIEQTGAACHTGEKSCFHNSIFGAAINSAAADVFADVYSRVLARRDNPKEGSYTNYLFDKGIDKICKKLGEEAAETIIAAKNNDKAEVIYEVSDLLYHLTVLLAHQGADWGDIAAELRRRMHD